MNQTSVKVRYFASLREHCGLDQETVALDTLGSVQDLFEKLNQVHHFPLKLSSLRVAINDEFASMNQTLSAGDEVVFIPPVAGG